MGKRKMVLSIALAALLLHLFMPGEVAKARPIFPEQPKEFSRQAIQSVNFLVAPAYDEPITEALANPGSITIAGDAEATQGQMVAFIRKHNPNPSISCSLEELVSYFYQEAGLEGLRADIVLCQAIKETGFFAYGGDVDPSQNNYCGLGAVGGGAKGASFATPQLGARAQVQHLLAYATYRNPQMEIIDPRFRHIVEDLPQVHGHITTWTGLNGIWAVPGTSYGQEILELWQRASGPDASYRSLVKAKALVAEEPDKAGSYIFRGIVYSLRGQYTAACQDFDRALSLNPQSAAARFDKALALARQGKGQEAFGIYSELLERHPEMIQAWYNRGMLALSAGNHQGAISDFEKAIKLDPRQVNAMNNIAIAQIKQGNCAEAWQTLQHAAQVNTNNRYVLGNQFILQACQKER